MSEPGFSTRSDVTKYVRRLIRESTEWSPWDACAQVRRPSRLRYEVRRSTPVCMLAGLGLAALALDFWFLGFVVDSGQVLAGLVAAAAAPAVFLVGRGAIIDGVSRRVTFWWGWIYKPLLRTSCEFSELAAVEIAKKLGPAGDANTGRTVRRPLYLRASDGRRLYLMTCTWVDAARAFASEIAKIVSVPVNEDFPGDQDSYG